MREKQEEGRVTQDTEYKKQNWDMILKIPLTSVTHLQMSYYNIYTHITIIIQTPDSRS